MNTKIKLRLGSEEFFIGQSFRSLMEFEKMTGKNSFSADASITDSLTVMYCMLKASNIGVFKYTFDEFLDILDENPDAIVDFNTYLTSLISIETAEDKKKVETR